LYKTFNKGYKGKFQNIKMLDYFDIKMKVLA